MDYKKIDLNNQRSEEIQHIISRMPTRFGFWVSMIVTVLFIVLLLFGWLVRYPDIVTGQIIINTTNAPLKLIANANGKLKLNAVKSMDNVKEGTVLAYIENPTNPTSVFYIDSLLKSFNLKKINLDKIRDKLPVNFSLGELNSKYYAFSNSLQDYINYKQDKLIEKQEYNYKILLIEQQKAIAITSKRVQMAKNNLSYVHKFYSRDSALFIKKIISESELDKAQMNYLSSNDGLQNSINNLINTKLSAHQTESKLQEISIQKPEKDKELRIALISTYNDLIDNIKSWEQKYVFKASFDGKIQFLKFYNENQFVQTGEQVFSIVPRKGKVFGQVFLPGHGSGKIKVGQEVIAKLDNYPYTEYGSITGRIKSISLTTNITKTDKSEIETYMILVDLPNQLKTNYGITLDFKADSRGSAEIVTNDRRLIQRLFDNLKYVIKK